MTLPPRVLLRKLRALLVLLQRDAFAVLHDRLVLLAELAAQRLQLALDRHSAVELRQCRVWRERERERGCKEACFRVYIWHMYMYNERT